MVTEGTIRVTDDLTAEMCKLVENTFRDINIAYANELSKVCDRLGIDVFNLINLANCHPRVNVHTPGVGVGGHCIAVDPWFIHEKFEDITPLIYEARTRKLLGACVAGARNAVLRADIFAVAIHAGMTTDELGMVDLAYAPPFAGVWDAVHIAANAAK